MNAVAPILHFARTRRDSPAIVDGDRTVTYAELAELVQRTAVHLGACGLKPGDRIGLCLKDNADHVVALLASAYLGAVAVPLDWRARPAEIARILAALELSRTLVEADAQLPAGSSAIPLDAEWHKAVARTDVATRPPAGWNNVFAISATSGSTGTPKFTQMTHLQYHFAIAGMLELMSLSGRHRFLSSLPLYYSGGRNSCMAHLLRGDCVVLYPSIFSPGEFVRVAAEQEITAAALVPSMVRQLLTVAGNEPLLPGIAAVFCSGAPLYAEEKLAALRKLSSRFHERYGTAETLAISILRPEDFAERATSIGQPHSLVEIEIVDENDHIVPHGQPGHMRIRGPGVASPLAGTTTTTYRTGWFYPGEIASVDRDGYIFLQGRTSDVIMRSGTKVYPAEIEAVLLDHAAVLDAAVVGYRGLDNEETAIAFVVSRAELTSGSLVAHCRARLTAHKIPREFRFLTQLPKNTAGKTDKAALAELLKDDSRVDVTSLGGGVPA